MQNKRINAHLSSSANAGYDMASGSARIERIKNAECIRRKGKRAMIAIMMILLFQFSLSFAENPSSTNYILQQWGFASGNDPANPPTSINYILTGSAIGIISDEDAVSANYSLMPGYYLGPIVGGILPPGNVIITVVTDSVNINWSAVTGASTYKVFSSNNPYTGFTEDISGNLTGTSWTAPLTGNKKYYYVTAAN